MIASGSWDNTVKLWMWQPEKRSLPWKGIRSWIRSMAFSPDGTMIASGSWDNTVKLWDVATREEIVTLEGHTHWIRSMAFPPMVR